ncbi:MAG: HAD family hydrolase [Phycisphaerales bacterium]
MNARALHTTIAAALITLAATPLTPLHTAHAQPDLTATRRPQPMASWAANETKTRILEFITRTTTPGSPDFIPEPKSIAVFDNDGTLWAEQPAYFQLLFAIDRIKAMAPDHPEWANTEPFKSILAGDTKALAAQGEHAIAKIIIETHAGLTTDQFHAIVAEWIATARHPTTGRPYSEMVYQPMLELLAHLRASGYKTFIVSGGGIDFMRVFAEQVYGIPPEQVVGSSGKVALEMRDGTPTLVKLPELAFIDDKDGKPIGIHNHIGRRPVMAFGNSDGDLQMLQYTVAGDGPRLAVIIHHTDADREWAYDRDSHIGQLDKALDEAAARGWVLVSMKDDWTTIYPAARSPRR